MAMQLCAVERQSNKTSTPRVSLNGKGHLVFNQACGAIIGNWKYAQLYYDSDRHCFGVKFVHDESEPQARKVAGKPGQNRRIYAADACQQCGVSVEQTIRYGVEYDESKRMMIIDLNKPLGSRAKKASRQ